jgi:hypothetical protein
VVGQPRKPTTSPLELNLKKEKEEKRATTTLRDGEGARRMDAPARAAAVEGGDSWLMTRTTSDMLSLKRKGLD